jgi:hypothetical protein
MGAAEIEEVGGTDASAPTRRAIADAASRPMKRNPAWRQSPAGFLWKCAAETVRRERTWRHLNCSYKSSSLFARV